jgi:hypothetical protein
VLFDYRNIWITIRDKANKIVMQPGV